MTREQAKQAYRLAYATAVNRLHLNSNPKAEEPFRTNGVVCLGLTDEERDAVWNAARDDLSRRFGSWTDDQIRMADGYAEIYAAIYAAHDPS